MGVTRAAADIPAPKFQENLIGRSTGGSSIGKSVSGVAGGSSLGKKVSGVAGGSSILKSVSGVGRPSASASISGSRPTTRGFTSPSEGDDDKDMRFNAFADAIQNKARSEGMNVTKTFFSNEELQKMVKEREASRERIKNVSERLMQKARDKKENNERLSDIASDELDQFNIKNYRAGGAEYDRDDKTSSPGGGLGMFVRGA